MLVNGKEASLQIVKYNVNDRIISNLFIKGVTNDLTNLAFIEDIIKEEKDELIEVEIPGYLPSNF